MFFFSPFFFCPYKTNPDFSLQREKFSIHSEIYATSTANLQPPLDENALFQELVAQFLAHEGYVDTARAFAEEVAAESAALDNGRKDSLKKYEVEEGLDAINRQSKNPFPLPGR